MGCSNLLWGVTHRGMGFKNGHFGRYVIIEWSLRFILKALRNKGVWGVLICYGALHIGIWGPKKAILGVT